MSQDIASAPEEFRRALRSIQAATTRPDVMLVETPAPTRVAPFALSISGEITGPDAEASGRFVLLYDPEGQDAWDGTFRIVTLTSAVVEAEVGDDDMWSDVAWSWLDDSLVNAPHRELGGTVTKTVSRSFGSLADRPLEVTVEMRMSWTPASADIAPHIAAWTELLAFSAGIPPTPEGVSMLRPGRTA